MTKIVLLVTMFQFIMAFFKAQGQLYTAVPSEIEYDKNCDSTNVIYPTRVASVPLRVWERYGGCAKSLSVTCKDGQDQCSYANAQVDVQMISFYEGKEYENILALSFESFEKIAAEGAKTINIKIRAPRNSQSDPYTAVPGGIEYDENCDSSNVFDLTRVASVPLCVWEKYGGCGKSLLVTCKVGLDECAYPNAQVPVQMVSYYEGQYCDDSLTLSNESFQEIADEDADEVSIRIRAA